MGNKSIEVEKNSTFILCQFCYNKVPLIELFIENNKAKIKLTCTCEESQAYSCFVMDLSEYLKKIYQRDPILFKCNSHENNQAVTFCFNCEKRLCEECLKTNHKEECQQTTQHPFPLCKTHSKNREFICKRCHILFCEKCAEAHTSFVKANKNEMEHKIINVKTYLSEQRLEKKRSKLNSFKEYVMKINEETAYELINAFNPIKEDPCDNDDDNKDQIEDDKQEHVDHNKKQYEILTNINSKEYKIQKSIEQAFHSYKEQNNELIDFFELMFLNISQQILKPITNTKLFLNIIKNTSFITNNISFPLTVTSNEDKSHFLIDYLKTSFLFKTLSYQMSFHKSLKTSSDTISFLYVLPNNKFLSIADTLIQLWNGTTSSKIANLTGHTNSIQSICTLSSDTFASASSDKTIRIWSINRKECISILNINGMPSFIFNNKFNSNEIGYLVFGKKIEIFNIETAMLEREYEYDKSAWFDNFYIFSNGNIVLGKSNGFIVIDGKSMEKKEEVRMGGEPIVFGENGERVVVGVKEDNCLVVFEKGFQERKKFGWGHDGMITGLIWVKEEVVLTSSVDYTMKLWNVRSMECVETFHVAKNEINGVIRLDDGKFVGCLNSNWIEVWVFEDYEEG